MTPPTGPVATAPDDESVPGLAGERTDLAWSRSGLAVLACAASVLKRVLDDIDDLTAPTVVLSLIAAGACAWVLALLHARSVAATGLSGRPIADPRVLRLVARGTAALAVGALGLAL